MNVISGSVKIQYALKLIGYVLFFVAFFLALARLDTYLRFTGIDNCATASLYETSTKDSKVAYPVTDVYNQCLQDKGLK